MANVKSTELPIESLLRQRVESKDFLDCYCVVSDIPPRRAAEIITNFPRWAELLLLIRGILVVPFGLMKEGPEGLDMVGIFPVEKEAEHELIAGFDDKHLNFRVSVISQGGRVYLATWVHPHNIFGRVYLNVILPFHILIARDALSRVAREA